MMRCYCAIERDGGLRIPVQAAVLALCVVF